MVLFALYKIANMSPATIIGEGILSNPIDSKCMTWIDTLELNVVVHKESK